MAAGGTISNLTALTAARERALPGVRHEGVSGRRLALYCSAEAHYSVRRAAEVLGIGGRNVRTIPLDAQPPHGPARLRRRDRRRPRAPASIPVAVVATAGTTLTGAVDDLDALADVCADARASGCTSTAPTACPAAATELAGHLFAGLDRVDSATVDAHKWLYVPKACSVLLVRDRDALEAAFTHDESYIPHTDREDTHPVDRTLEYSRPLSALKLWLAFRVHGAAAIRAAIERNLRQARLLAELDPRGPAARAARRAAALGRLLPPPPARGLPRRRAQRRDRRARSARRRASCSRRRPSTACPACAPASSTTAPARTTCARSSRSCASSATRIARSAR